MELQNFNLQEYNDTKEHRPIIIQLWNDELSNKYLYDLSKEVKYLQEKNIKDQRNNAYIVYYDSNPIGYISLKVDDNRCVISYGLIPEYRGKHLCTKLLQQLSRYILEIYQDVDNLILIIQNTNIGSIKVATNAGYKKESIIKYVKKREGK